MNEILIELHNVVKAYETPAGAFLAINGIDLKISAGEFVAIIGKSGSGKSTLINLLTGIDRVSSGEIYVAGTALHELSEKQIAPWRGQHIGVIFQFFQLLPTLSLVENIILPMEYTGRFRSLRERREHAMHLLDMVELTDQADKMPAMVSGGQQQRAAIARALANDPDILVADEPTGSLDSKTADAIMRIFDNFVSQGRTLLMVTHDRELARRASRVVYIADGEITDRHVVGALPVLTKRQLVDVFSQLEPVNYIASELIIREGDVAQHLFIIVKGEVNVFLDYETEQVRHLNRLGEGQYFGEIGLLTSKKRIATVCAAQETDVVVMQLDRTTFVKVLEESNLAKEDVFELLRRRSAQTTLSTLGLDSTQISEIGGHFVQQQFAPDTYIIQQGQAAEAFYLIINGSVEVLNEQPDGQVILVAELAYGDYFGEVGLLNESPSGSTVRAAETGVDLMVVDRTTFHNLISRTMLAQEDVIAELRDRVLGMSMGRLGLAPDKLDAIKGEFEFLNYEPGEEIVSPSARAGHVFVVLAGAVEVVFHRMSKATPIMTKRLFVGEYFGELDSVRHGRHSRTIRAAPDSSSVVELAAFSARRFRQLIEQHDLVEPQINLTFNTLLSERLHEFMDSLQRRPRAGTILDNLFADERE